MKMCVFWTFLTENNNSLKCTIFKKIHILFFYIIICAIKTIYGKRKGAFIVSGTFANLATVLTIMATLASFLATKASSLFYKFRNSSCIRKRGVQEFIRTEPFFHFAKPLLNDTPAKQE